MKRFYLGSLMLAAMLSGGNAMAQVNQQAGESACGFSVSTGVFRQGRHHYQAWGSVANEAGESASSFTLFLDTSDTHIFRSMFMHLQPADGGYVLHSPFWLYWMPIPSGADFYYGYMGSGGFGGVTPYVLSVNGEPCDQTAPSVDLAVSQGFYSTLGSLSLSAEASDNVAVKKVVFERDGEVIGEDYEAPFTLDVEISAADNGNSLYSATAYDISGNTASSSSEKVFVSIGNRFLGSAPGSSADYEDMLSYFNQLTPEDAGKWGSVEAERDVMNWDGLDQAYSFAKQNGMPIKLHTLVWGNQAPEWIADLPPEEQLEEITEWYALVSERYPDAEMVDVVNEPMHAPPPYAEALGGDGETGWDWVITAFEMAREYFPNSQLLLNDYHVLILENFTQDYLAVVDVLQQRGLIDGIGVQAHFLERADLETVENNVATLAATGLPIYVSELDVDFADDARQATRLKDLFTIFWNNPAVLGVTHWGHLQGDIWQTNAYLIRSDKSLRPAMEWLQCFYAGGTACSVPEYLPAGWEGTENGLTLQAEEYDDAKGLAALGNAVTYTDGGDWFAFFKVNFSESWDLFTLNYTKGMDSETTLSVHLDSLDSAPILEMPLVNTGDWSTAAEIELALPPISGEHDVYFSFNGESGAGNVDFIRFGLPPEPGQELVENGDFENGDTAGWFSWGGTVQATTAPVYEGAYALQLTQRSGNGPAAYSLLGKVTPGENYQLSLAATISGADTADVNITLKSSCQVGEAVEDDFAWAINPVTITAGEWVEMSGQLSIPDCELTDLLIFAEGPEETVDIYLDNVSVTGAPVGAGSILINGGFETGLASSWYSWDGTVSVTSEIAYEGSNALLLSEREGNGPAATTITSLVTSGASYSSSVAVTIGGAESAPVNITLKTVCDGEEDYSWIGNSDAVVAGEWSVLSSQLNVPECEDLSEVTIFAEGPDGGIDLYVDSVVIVPL